MPQPTVVAAARITLPIAVLCPAERRCRKDSHIVEPLLPCKRPGQGQPFRSTQMRRTPSWTKSVKILRRETLSLRICKCSTNGRTQLIHSLSLKWWQTVCIINSTFLDPNLAARVTIFQINFWRTTYTKSKVLQKMLQIEISTISLRWQPRSMPLCQVRVTCQGFIPGERISISRIQLIIGNGFWQRRRRLRWLKISKRKH